MHISIFSNIISATTNVPDPWYQPDTLHVWPLREKNFHCYNTQSTLQVH